MFVEHRGLLHAVAYRVLGSVTEAEDVVQDAWLRWSRVDPAAVSDAEGYLVRVTTRLAVDRLRSARVRRESYVGPWLPEPMLTSPDVAENVVLADSVSTAMLLVLEALSPVERAVFVLSEAFGYSHAEIAGFTGRSDASVLAPDVILVSDGGGFTGAPRKPIRGIVYVARAIVVLSRRRPAGSDARLLHVNGGPGIVIYSGRTPVLAFTLHLADGAIKEMHVVSNPEKLHGVMT